ncbi:unnamed protein product [Blepharisma stoltei]|uniref:Uncharacterized protein n=1 Tax=Blepharisma stoltei TaxID=1481888 RepID=A0AAU9JQZ0_9CILI|nr:unnamed protein product [Blepharisma stoltei]
MYQMKNRLSEEQAARIIQRAIRNRKSRNNPATLQEMRHAELELLKLRHRQRLEAKEREYLFLSKLPAEAVLRLALKKQADAAVIIQAFWRGRKTRKLMERERLITQTVVTQPKSAPRKFQAPPDTFYKPIDPVRHEALIKQIRLKGRGNLEIYKEEYSKFLDRQVAWDKLRSQKYSDRNEVKYIIKSLETIKALNDPLKYTIQDATPQEVFIAKEIHKRKIPDPKKWWKGLENDDEWDLQILGGNVLDQIQNYKMEMYRNRRMEFAE